MSMELSKVIITNTKVFTSQFCFENEVGLSSYDLALMSRRRILKRSKADIEETSKISYLI